MLDNVKNLYRILLPKWVFDVNSEEEKTENAVNYLRKSYPDRRLVELEKEFAICEKLNNLR